MADQMIAAVFHASADVRVEKLDIPTPVAGEVLVKVLRSGICGTDASEYKSGPKMFPINAPHAMSGHVGPMVIGHEFIGEVIGQGTGGFNAGDLVASGAGISCGKCVRCQQGRTNLCDKYVTLGLNRHGGLAEYVCVPVSTLVKIPAEMNLDAAGIAQPLAVGLHAARRSGAKDGDRVLLIGAGAIGTFVLTALKHLVNVEVAVMDFAGSRLERATRLGADNNIAASAGRNRPSQGICGRRRHRCCYRSQRCTGAASVCDRNGQARRHNPAGWFAIGSPGNRCAQDCLE